MSPNSQSRFVDGIDHYNNWRNEKRAQAFLGAVHSHALTTIKYNRTVPEHIDMVMSQFDKHFPESK